jgi:hypothetical protein
MKFVYNVENRAEYPIEIQMNAVIAATMEGPDLQWTSIELADASSSFETVEGTRPESVPSTTVEVPEHVWKLYADMPYVKGLIAQDQLKVVKGISE